MIEFIKVIVLIAGGFLSIILFALGWQILKCPNQLWEKCRKNPTRKCIREILGND